MQFLLNSVILICVTFQILAMQLLLNTFVIFGVTFFILFN